MEFYKRENGISSISTIMIIVAILVLVGSVFVYRNFTTTTTTTTNNKGVLIGFSITSLQEDRWQIDKREFTKRANELGATIDLQIAQNNAEKQASQIESMIIKGVDVLVVVPYDANSLSNVITKAHNAGIKVISYDRMISNADVDIYLSFDNEKVGEYQAQYVMDVLGDKLKDGSRLKVAYVGGSELDNNSLLLKKGSFKVLQPKIDKKQIEIVFDKFTKSWSPDVAYENIKAYLKKSNGKIDAIVAANDGTAFGSITALSEYNLGGKVPVSGQDAELAAVQRIVKGTQTMTVYKPIPKLASSAAEIAMKLIDGEKVQTNSEVNNGKINVPSVLLDPIAVTKDNIDTTIISDGYLKKEDVYKK